MKMLLKCQSTSDFNLLTKFRNSKKAVFVVVAIKYLKARCRILACELLFSKPRDRLLSSLRLINGNYTF